MILVVRKNHLSSSLILVFLHFFTILSLFLLGACVPKISVKSISGDTMGTTYSVKYVVAELIDQQGLAKEIDDHLIAFNKIFSTYDPDSEISLFNKNHRKSSGIEVSDEFAEQLNKAIVLSFSTGKTFDPTVSPLVNLWGFGWTKRDNRDENFQLPDQKRVEEELKKVGIDKVRVDGKIVHAPDEMMLDFSAISKGRAVDEVGELLEEKGINNYLVEIGGEIRIRGNKEMTDQNESRTENQNGWKVFIANPEKSDNPIPIAVNNQSIATSGNYNNYYVQDGDYYSHTIDPRSGYPVSHQLASVSVIIDNCEDADALATAIMVMGVEVGKAFAEENNLAVHFIYRTGDQIQSVSSKKFMNYLTK